MDYSELIHDLVDGTLSTSNEEKVFLALSADPELRKELNYFMDMERATSHDHAAFTTPETVTAGLFSTIGINKPYTAAASGTTPSKNTAPRNKFSQFLVVGLASATLTAFLFLMLWQVNTPTGTQQPANNSTLAENVNKTDVGTTNQSFVSVAFDSISKTQKNPEVIIKYIEVPVYPEEYKSRIAANEAVHGNDLTAVKPSAISQMQTSSDAKLSEQQTIPYYSQPLPKGYDIVPISINRGFLGNNKFSVEIKGGQYYSIPNADVNRSTEPFFENGSVLLMYKLNENISIGAEVRQEFFFQSFTGMADGKDYRYKQHTNYFSGGIFARMNLFDFYGCTSMVQLGLGLARPGPIGRGMVGLQYSAYNNLDFILGLEASILTYTHNANYFYSPKLGLHYGIKIKL